MAFVRCPREPNVGPVKAPKPLYEYRVATETSGATSYIFDGDDLPTLEFNSAGIDLESVNHALKYLKLPEVTEAVRDGFSITGLRADVGAYHWDDYELGPMTVAATPCRMDHKWQACIWKVTVSTNEKVR